METRNRLRKLLLRCPGCRQTMQYQPRGKSVGDKRKRCVYCNRSFKVRGNIIRML